MPEAAISVLPDLEGVRDVPDDGLHAFRFDGDDIKPGRPVLEPMLLQVRKSGSGQALLLSRADRFFGKVPSGSTQTPNLHEYRLAALESNDVDLSISAPDVPCENRKALLLQKPGGKVFSMPSQGSFRILPNWTGSHRQFSSWTLLRPAEKAAVLRILA